MKYLIYALLFVIGLLLCFQSFEYVSYLDPLMINNLNGAMIEQRIDEIITYSRFSNLYIGLLVIVLDIALIIKEKKGR